MAVLILVTALAGLCVPTHASAFLGSHHHVGSGTQHVSQADVDAALVSEFGSSGEHVRRIEEEFRQLYTSLPKNKHGKLEPSVTRYALHRYFAQKFGWYVVGLEPAGGSYDAPLLGNIMKNRVPAYIESLFEKRLHGHGFGLREVAVFAATLLDLIHKESVDDLDAIYAHKELDPLAPLSRDSMDQVMHGYVLLYIHSFDASSNHSMNLKRMERELLDDYVIWEDVVTWSKDYRHTLQAEQSRLNPFSHPGTFDRVAQFAQGIGHHFGSFQNLECQSLKGQLMELEYKGTGRVRLSDFYSGAEDSSWTFTESVDYLRALGALDETVPNVKSVIIPNFLASQTNCVTPSNLYSVCCLNECEGLMAALEGAIAGPMAEPARISEIVAALRSDTVDAPRTLAVGQIQRLEQIAKMHGGQVPLHGRLFAQWMHHAYPRECPYPHVAGATNPVSHDEWIKMEGSVEASVREMKQHAFDKTAPEELKASLSHEAQAEVLPWIEVEELVVSLHHQQDPWTFSNFKYIAYLIVLSVSALQATKVSKQPRKIETHLV